MKHIRNNIESLEDLPNRTNRAAYLAEKFGNVYNTNIYRRDWYTGLKQNPWMLVKKLLQHYTNKKFDDFFNDWSKRCQHHDLLMEYKYYAVEQLLAFNHASYNRYKPYFVDDEGILRKRDEFPKFYKQNLKKKHPQYWYEQQASHRKALRETIEKEYKFKRDDVISNKENCSKDCLDALEHLNNFASAIFS